MRSPSAKKRSMRSIERAYLSMWISHCGSACGPSSLHSGDGRFSSGSAPVKGPAYGIVAVVTADVFQ